MRETRLQGTETPGDSTRTAHGKKKGGRFRTRPPVGIINES
jgi:hypothetical protein